MTRKTEKQRSTVELKRPSGDPKQRLARKLARLEEVVRELKATADGFDVQGPLWDEVADIADDARETLGFARLTITKD